MEQRNIKHQTIDIDSIQPHPKNVRQGDIGAISESLKAHGQYRPIVVDERTNQILAGNHTWKAAKALGWSQIQVSLIQTKDDDEALRILLADNKATDLADYDNDGLEQLLKQLAESDNGLLGSLYDGDDLDLLINDNMFVETVGVEDKFATNTFNRGDCSAFRDCTVLDYGLSEELVETTP
jgi:ParB-like chromosome segregation protein Spo0J